MAIQSRRQRRRSHVSFEKLESKKLLASFGWDGVGQGDV